MQKSTAKKIIHSHNLIPRRLGRQLLHAIENNLPMHPEWPRTIDQKQFELYKEQYAQKSKELNNAPYPRNFILYHLIKNRLPEFSWEIQGTGKIYMNTPRIHGLRLSLASLLFCKLDEISDSLLDKKYRCTKILSKEVSRILSDVFNKIDVIYPDEKAMEKIVNWICAGLNQETLTIFSPICPDYSVEATDNPACPYRHTFKSLGSGLGLIAQRILTAIPILIEALTHLGLKVNAVIGIGDFEAYSDANLARLNITRETFLERVTKSKQAFESASVIPMDVQMISDMLGGYHHWLDIYRQFTNQLNTGNFGASELTSEKLLKIVAKRKNLYDRWYGEKSLSDHLPQLMSQGAEYAVLGWMIAKTMKNCVVLGADNDAMSPFYSILQSVPTLFLKRFYC